MALIGKIREKSWLLIIVVGIAMLAFIIGDLDFLSSGPKSDVYGIGTINGEKINEEQYNVFLNNARNNILQNKFNQNPNQQPTFNEYDMQNAMQQAWETIISNSLTQKEYEKLGLIVDEVELENVLYGENGFSPSPFSLQFTDSVTGEFSPSLLRQYMESIRSSNNIEDFEQYNAIVEYVSQLQLGTKYNTLLKAGVHATSLEGKKEYEAKETVKNISYVFQNFSRIPFGAVEEPTQEEMKSYFDLHKNDKKYKQKASKKIRYFTVPIKPSAEDSLKAEDFLVNLTDKFEQSNNDSAFVMRYSDVKSYISDSTSVAKPEGYLTHQGRTYPVSLSKEFENAEIGEILGPYSSQGRMQISKVIGHKFENVASVRHILLTVKDPNHGDHDHSHDGHSHDDIVAEDINVIQKRADSIIKVISEQHNFEAMVSKFSEDIGSIETGGKYEDFNKGTMVPEFEDFAFNKPIGTLGTVKTSYGVHIVEVLGRRTIRYPMLIHVVKNVEATKTTADEINGIASNYIYEIDDLFDGKSIEQKREIFDTFAIKHQYQLQSITILDDAPVVQGVSEVAEGRFLRLAYDENVKSGNISSSPMHDKNRFIIAFVSDIIDEGTPKFEWVEHLVREDVIREKQVQYLMDKMVGKTDLNALARDLGAMFETESITFSTTNLAVGNEPKIIGAAFSGLMDGETSIPLRGKEGVFVLRVDLTIAGQETDDYSTEQEAVKSQNRNHVFNQAQNALIESSEIIDNRKLRSLGIR